MVAFRLDEIRQYILSDDPCVCGDELMCLDEFREGVSTGKRAKPFSCRLLPYLELYGLLKAQKARIKAAAVIPKKVVVYTYSSANHFEESRAMLNRFRMLVPENKLIYFDVGLKPEQIDELKTICNLEIRKLDFSLFPSFIGNNLMNYAFKVLVMAEAFRESDYFWLLDTSVRVVSTSKLTEFYDRFNQGNFEDVLLRAIASHSFYATTSPGMFEYLPLHFALLNLPMLEANTIFVRKSNFSAEALKWHLLCALTEDCIVPKGSKVHCEFPWPNRHDFKSDCHRFDQASINLIVANLLESPSYVGLRNKIESRYDGAFREFISIQRGNRALRLIPLDCNAPTNRSSLDEIIKSMGLPLPSTPL